MTELEKAARQALEALESCEMSNYGRDWVWPATAHETAMKNVKEAITALREALAEQPAQTEFKPDWMNYQQGLADGAAAEREACLLEAKYYAKNSETARNIVEKIRARGQA